MKIRSSGFELFCYSYSTSTQKEKRWQHGGHRRGTGKDSVFFAEFDKFVSPYAGGRVSKSLTYSGVGDTLSVPKEVAIRRLGAAVPYRIFTRAIDPDYDAA